MTDASAILLPRASAARELGVAERTLRDWIAAGAPVARPGRRGRGGSALFDVRAVAAWRRRRTVRLSIEQENTRAESQREIAAALAVSTPFLVGEVLDVFLRDLPESPARRQIMCAVLALFEPLVHVLHEPLTELSPRLAPPVMPTTVVLWRQRLAHSK